MSPEERFRDYMDAFNSSDWDRLLRHYSPDIRLVIGNGTELVGRQAIIDFYSKVKTQTRRTIEILRCFADGNLLAAELQSEFLALVDAPDFAVRPMSQGDRYFINSFALYESRNDQYCSIRAAVFRREYRPANPV